MRWMGRTIRSFMDSLLPLSLWHCCQQQQSNRRLWQHGIIQKWNPYENKTANSPLLHYGEKGLQKSFLISSMPLQQVLTFTFSSKLCLVPFFFPLQFCCCCCWSSCCCCLMLFRFHHGCLTLIYPYWLTGRKTPVTYLPHGYFTLI